MGLREKIVPSRLRRVIIVIIVVVSLIAICSCSKHNDGGGNDHGVSSRTGSVAPDFRLQDLQGKEIALSQYRGKVVLLEFWATWCPPCRATVPELIALQKKYRGKDFSVLGVSVDDEGENRRAELSAFSKQFNINYPVLMGSDSVARAYEIWSIPRSFLIDRSGKIRDSYSGYVYGFQKKVSAEIERLL